MSGIPAFEDIRDVIRHHHVRYEDTQRGRVNPSEVPEECWFLHLADRIDIYARHFADSPDPKEALRHEIRSRFGRDFLPELRGAFERATENEQFWHNAEELSFQELLLNAVDTEMKERGPTDLESVALLFGRIVDSKSHWTLTHSQSVGAVAERIAQFMGFPEQTSLKLRIAGYLHDIGKIAVPSEILEKPGPLDGEELRKMQEHASISALILSGSDELAEIGRWAGSHHERLDQFECEIDILAYADVFTALLEARPYRDPMPAEEAMTILKSLCPAKLSQDVFNAISDHFSELQPILNDENEWDPATALYL